MGNSPEVSLSSHPLNDQIQKRKSETGNKDDTMKKYQYYLNYLCKNNFCSLAYEDLCAFIVQLHWRRFYFDKITKTKKGMIDIIYSSLEFNPNVSSHQENTFHIVNSRKYPYRCYDLMGYKSLSKLVELFGGFGKLPLIFINRYYIGSYNEIQEMEDQKIIPSLIKGEYLKRCLVCNMPRESFEKEICYYCYKKYLYWAISIEVYNIYEMRY